MLPIEELRHQLVERRRALLDQVERAEDGIRTLVTSVQPEPEEEGQEENLTHLLASLDEHDRAEVAAIDEALRRMETGDYGRCAECGEPIPLERLQALPTATLCVTHAGARERR